MKRTLFLTFLIFQSIVLFSQTSLETTSIKGSTVIKPSYSNLVKLVFADFSEYRTAMKSNNYSLSTDGGGYCANSLYFTYLITKQTGQLMMAFANDDYSLISGLKREIESKFPNIRPSFEQGFEVYRIKLSDGTKIKFAIQEQPDGFAGVSIFLM